MFEALKSTPPSPAKDEIVVVAAAPGYAVLHFAPRPEVKPAASSLLEHIRESTYPVLGWRVCGDTMLPLTLCDPPTGALLFLSIGQQKWFAVDGTGRSWSTFDVFHEHLIQTWRTQRREAEPKPCPPGVQYTVPAGAKGAFTIPTSPPT